MMLNIHTKRSYCPFKRDHDLQNIDVFFASDTPTNDTEQLLQAILKSIYKKSSYVPDK